jgi:hypothetical protein
MQAVHDMANGSRLRERKGSMTSKTDLADLPVANYDTDRKGIFIHRNQLIDSGFKKGDRFSVKAGKQDLFAISIVKDDNGDIVFDKNGIFIERTRRIDILLGGIFKEYVLYFESDPRESIKIRPLEAVIKNNYMNPPPK